MLAGSFGTVAAAAIVIYATFQLFTPVQSYPIVGGIWQADFNVYSTVPTDLTISLVKPTSPDDLAFIGLYCNDVEVPFYGRLSGVTWYGANAWVYYYKWYNYQCDGISSWRVKVLTAGKHHQRIQFGRIRQDIYNEASDEFIWQIEDGNLFIGSKDNANIHTWDGVNWTMIENGVDMNGMDTVWGFCGYDGNVLVVGRDTSAGGMVYTMSDGFDWWEIANIATLASSSTAYDCVQGGDSGDGNLYVGTNGLLMSFDGNVWGTISANEVRSLVWHDGNVWFRNPNDILRFDGTVVTLISDDVDSWGLGIYEGVLYSSFGAQDDVNLYSWTGKDWNSVGSIFNDTGAAYTNRKFIECDGNLYIGMVDDYGIATFDGNHIHKSTASPSNLTAPETIPVCLNDSLYYATAAGASDAAVWRYEGEPGSNTEVGAAGDTNTENGIYALGTFRYRDGISPTLTIFQPPVDFDVNGLVNIDINMWDAQVIVSAYVDGNVSSDCFKDTNTANTDFNLWIIGDNNLTWDSNNTDCNAVFDINITVYALDNNVLNPLTQVSRIVHVGNPSAVVGNVNDFYLSDDTGIDLYPSHILDQNVVPFGQSDLNGAFNITNDFAARGGNYDVNVFIDLNLALPNDTNFAVCKQKNRVAVDDSICFDVNSTSEALIVRNLLYDANQMFWWFFDLNLVGVAGYDFALDYTYRIDTNA